MGNGEIRAYRLGRCEEPVCFIKVKGLHKVDEDQNGQQSGEKMSS